jgi:hypothetical protein
LADSYQRVILEVGGGEAQGSKLKEKSATIKIILTNATNMRIKSKTTIQIYQAFTRFELSALSLELFPL